MVISSLKPSGYRRRCCEDGPEYCLILAIDALAPDKYCHRVLQERGCKRDSGVFQAPMERRSRLFWRWIMVESSVAARWSGMGSAVVRGFGRARAGVCLAAAQAASSRAVVGPKPGPGRRGGRLDILGALLRGARAAAFALAALALGVPGEAEAQDVLFVSNLDQDDDNNSNDARDRAQRFTTGSNPAGYTLTSVEIRSEDAESDDATVSICTIDGRGYPTSSCTLLTVPSSFAAGIARLFRAQRSQPFGQHQLHPGGQKPRGESLDLDATRADGEDSAEVAGWSIADPHNTNNTSGWGISGSGKSLRIAVKGLVKIASNAATGIVHPRVLMDTQITVGGYRVGIRLTSTNGDMRPARLAERTWPMVAPRRQPGGCRVRVPGGRIYRQEADDLEQVILRSRDRERGRGGPAGHGRGRDRAAGVADRRDRPGRLAAAGAFRSGE